MPSLAPTIELRDLVEHADSVDASKTLNEVQAEFTRRGRRFLGVLESGKFLGVVNGRKIAQRLSAQFGIALFGRAAVREHVMAQGMVVMPSTPLTVVLQKASARADEDFYSDIALVADDGVFLGMIPVHRLVRLQTSLLLANIDELEVRRREIAERHRQMEDDLRMAGQVQMALLPSQPLRLCHGDLVLETGHACMPAEIVGGDFHAAFPIGSGEAGVLVCDVMGHGVRSALVTAIMRALVQDGQMVAHDPGAFLTRLNAGLHQILDHVHEMIFVTAAFVVIDLDRKQVRYAQAGHPTPLLWRAARRAAAPIGIDPDAAGPALGLLGDSIYESVAAPFEPGDQILLFTDGLLEAVDGGGDEFGGERLSAAFARAAESGSETIVPDVIRAVQEFAGGRRFGDDVCAVVARLTAKCVGAACDRDVVTDAATCAASR